MMRLAQAAQVLGGIVLGADVAFCAVSTDSRALEPGELFVALRGERFDGHAFVAAAARAGAAAALVERGFDTEGAPLPLVIVEDTRLALGRLARHWRAQFAPVLIAITGSNGKTTTKEMLASILRAAAGEASVLATAGNLNNDIGLPLTLLRLTGAHRYCAIELGMNHRGEIAYLADIAQPTVGLVNNAQREHLEFMGSVAEVAEENSSVFRALPEDGVAVVNADDAHANVFRRAAGARRVVDFGLLEPAAVSARYQLGHLSSQVRIACPAGDAQATLAIAGLHNVMNALAAAACAQAAGIAPAAIGAGLTAFRAYAGRLQVKRSAEGATVIDDSYNANPDSVRAAIDVLAGAQGHTLLVLGDMGEVGEQGPDFHLEVGRYAKERGIGAVFALGESTAHTVAGYGTGARHFATLEDLIHALRAVLDPQTTLLVKGSRCMQMERVVLALSARSQAGTSANGRTAEAH